MNMKFGTPVHAHMAVDSFEEICTLCGQQIQTYIPDHFMGEKINPCCFNCNMTADNEYGQDPFASFPDFGLPSSLVSHWIPPNISSFGSIGMTSSLRAHYTQLPNPGDTFISMQEILEEFREMRILRREETIQGRLQAVAAWLLCHLPL